MDMYWTFFFFFLLSSIIYYSLRSLLFYILHLYLLYILCLIPCMTTMLLRSHADVTVVGRQCCRRACQQRPQRSVSSVSPQPHRAQFLFRYIRPHNVSLTRVVSVVNQGVDHASSYRSEPYDPYLPRGGSSTGGAPPAAGPSQGNAKTAAIQAQIDDTVGIMRENITKVAERGERLDSLQDKTGAFSLSLFFFSGSCFRCGRVLMSV